MTKLRLGAVWLTKVKGDCLLLAGFFVDTF